MSLFQEISKLLTKNITENGKVSIALSGGKSPVSLYQKLSEQDVDWSKVTVTLVDERLVPPCHPDSNQGLVVRTLLNNKAQFAKFIPLQKWPDGEIPDIGLLGMGLDGHIASLFPAMIEEAHAFDPNAAPKVIKTPVLGNPPCSRLTMTLSMILSIRHRFLIVHGHEKKLLLNSIVNSVDLPLNRLLRHPGTQVIHKKY
jgi:6-phosphogluconolactonase